VGDLARDQYGYWQTGDIIINNTAHQFGVNNPTCNRMGLDAKLFTITSHGYRLLENLSFYYSMCIAFFIVLILL
jgi:calcium channel MID1